MRHTAHQDVLLFELFSPICTFTITWLSVLSHLFCQAPLRLSGPFSPPAYRPSSPAGPWCSAAPWRCPAREGWVAWVGWARLPGTWCAPPASRGPCTAWRKVLAAGAQTLHRWLGLRSGAPVWVPRWWPLWGCHSGARAHSSSTSKVSLQSKLLNLSVVLSMDIHFLFLPFWHFHQGKFICFSPFPSRHPHSFCFFFLYPFLSSNLGLSPSVLLWFKKFEDFRFFLKFGFFISKRKLNRFYPPEFSLTWENFPCSFKLI